MQFLSSQVRGEDSILNVGYGFIKVNLKGFSTYKHMNQDYMESLSCDLHSSILLE